MDFRQLEAFVRTVELRSFTAAAQKLFLSQPTISSHVRALEKQLGTQLIRRTSKEFVVTPEGERLYKYALGLLRMREHATNELSGQSSSDLMIGVSTIPAQTFLPLALKTYLDISPDAHFVIQQSESLDIIEKISLRNLEIGFVGMKKEDGLCTYVPLLLDELVIAAPNTEYYQRMKERNASSKELLQEPIILRSQLSALEKEAEAFIASIGLSLEDLNVVARVNDAQLVARCVAQGVGIAFISKSAVEEDVKKNDTILFALSTPPLERTLYMVYREDEFLSESARRFVRTITKHFSLSDQS